MLLPATMAFGRAKEDAGDGKMLKINRPWEFKVICRRFPGTIRGKVRIPDETSKAVLKYVMHASVFREMCIDNSL